MAKQKGLSFSESTLFCSKWHKCSLIGYLMYYLLIIIISIHNLLLFLTYFLFLFSIIDNIFFYSHIVKLNSFCYCTKIGTEHLEISLVLVPSTEMLVLVL